MAKIWVDGAGALFEGQKASIAFVSEDGAENIKELGRMTNNEAEYLAVIEALKTFPKGCTIYSDSQLVVGQLTKGWKVKSKNLLPYFKEAMNLMSEKQATLVWIPRKDNRAGHLLESTKSYRRFCDGKKS